MLSNISVWENETYFAPQNIVIVGGGLMGLWTAITLKEQKPNLSITVVERNVTPLGASTRNAGFSCFGSPTELLHDAKTLGESAMLQIVEKRYKGIEKIKKYFGNVIDFDACGGYECLTEKQLPANEINDALAYLNKLLADITNTHHTFKRNDAALTALGLQNFDALVENKWEGGLHSGKLVQALQSKAACLGVNCLYGITVTHCYRQNDYVAIETQQSIVLKANTVILCANAFSNAINLGTTLPLKPGRGQILLTSPIPNLPLLGTFHYDAGFYYWRNLGNRILIGGGRNSFFEQETTTDIAVTENVQTVLENFLQTHLNPSIQYTIDKRWSGIMAFTDNHLPYVHFTAPNILNAIACNGMGVALTPIIAEEIAHQILPNF